MSDSHLPLLGGSDSAPAPAYITDVTEQNFERDVLSASMQKPVIVDFWAPWCAPCKQMMPLLEKTVLAAKGAVLMAKVNIDKSPGLAQALRIQSVPTVYAFFQGKPVDGFTGALPESEIKAFVGKLIPLAGLPPRGGVDTELLKNEMAKADDFFRGNNAEAAMEHYAQALEIDPDSIDALGGIGWCLLMQGDRDAAADMLTQLTPEQKSSPRLKGLQFVLSLQAPAKPAADGPQSFYDQALGNFSAGKLEEGIDGLILLIRKHRDWEDKKANTLLLDLLEALGPMHPLTAPSRRKLSTVLFS